MDLAAVAGPSASVCRGAITGEQGVALPPFTDHHVHTHLIDLTALPAGGIAGVLDLGGDPVALFRAARAGMPRLAYAGAFLTVPGGYPAGRAWAPQAMVREITGFGGLGVAGGAETAVDEQAEFAASVVKVALNAATGPVFDPATLAAVVARAHERGLPVVAHVEGTGMTRLAVDAGVAVLAHTPFTEAVDPALIARAVAAGQRWISTLGLHDGADLDRAVANMAAFRAAGGQVLYGTDLGNGDMPLGVNLRELRALDRAGVRGTDLVAALTDPWPFPAPPHGVATFIPGPSPSDLADVPEWLTGARVVPTEELIHDEH